MQEGERKKSRRQKIKPIGAAVALSFGLPYVFNAFVCGWDLCWSSEPLVKIDAKTVYTGAATIAGLATFGSILSLRFSKVYEKYGSVEIGATTMLGSIVILILFQGILMLFACCGNLTQSVFVTILAASITCLVMAIIGLSKILDTSFSKDADLAKGA
ncbi:MAG: hypothetical protein J4F28_08810 [Nitrosopumilaceae archaeon]|nr:hypothetical protein [Nitrosopumilaceae archaeon]